MIVTTPHAALPGGSVLPSVLSLPSLTADGLTLDYPLEEISPDLVFNIDGPVDSAVRQGGATDFFTLNGNDTQQLFNEYQKSDEGRFGIVATHKPSGRGFIIKRATAIDELSALGEAALSQLLTGALGVYGFGKNQEADIVIDSNPVIIKPLEDESPQLADANWYGALGLVDWLNKRLPEGSFRIPGQQGWHKPHTPLFFAMPAKTFPLSDAVRSLFNPLLIQAQQLPPNHPGIRDPEYVAARTRIAQSAQNYLRAGNLRADVPDVNYTEQEQAAWSKIWGALSTILDIMGCQEYLDKMTELNFPKDKIPQMAEVNNKIIPLTGFRFAPVEGLLHSASFMAIMANRVFPAAQFLRYTKGNCWQYSVEPDFFHELAHAISLAIQEHAEVNEAFGKAALRILDEVSRYQDPEEQMKVAQELTGRLGALYWWGVEFFMLHQKAANDDATPLIKVGGPGALSSTGELTNLAANSHQLDQKPAEPVEFRPLDPKTMEADRLIDVTEFQDRVYVAENYRDWAQTMLAHLRNWPHVSLDPKSIRSPFDYESVLNTPSPAKESIIDQIANMAKTGDLFESAYCVKTLILLLSHHVEYAGEKLYELIAGVSHDTSFDQPDRTNQLRRDSPTLWDSLHKVKMDVLARMTDMPLAQAILGLFKEVVQRTI